MSSPVERWEAALDALEAETAQLEFGLAAGDHDQIAEAGRWIPPNDLPTIPVELAERAMELADRMAAAEEQARAVRAELGVALNQLNTRRVANAAYVQHDGYPTQA